MLDQSLQDDIEEFRDDPTDTKDRARATLLGSSETDNVGFAMLHATYGRTQCRPTYRHHQPADAEPRTRSHPTGEHPVPSSWRATP